MWGKPTTKTSRIVFVLALTTATFACGDDDDAVEHYDRCGRSDTHCDRRADSNHECSRHNRCFRHDSTSYDGSAANLVGASDGGNVAAVA